MNTLTQVQGIIHAPHIASVAQDFLIACAAENLATGTVKFYRKKLAHFTAWLDTRAISTADQLTPAELRLYLIELAQAGHNPGGIHAHYRALKRFLRWTWDEYDLDLPNPIRKVKTPKLALDPLTPASLPALSAMIDVSGARDKAILLVLLDTGMRAAELCALNLADYNPAGTLLIRSGKGRKPRAAYLSAPTRRHLRRYIAGRTDASPALFPSRQGERLTYSGLRKMLQDRAAQAGVCPAPTAHAIRRLFAITMLRAGNDIYRVAELMGHTTIQVLKHYLKFVDEDRRAAHAQGSPVLLLNKR